MSIQQALGQLAGRPDLLAWRPNGKLFKVTDRMAMVVPWTDKSRCAIFTYADLVTDDWKVGDPKTMAKELKQDAVAGAA